MNEELGVLIYHGAEKLEEQMKSLAAKLRALDEEHRAVQHEFVTMALYLTHLRGLAVSLNTSKEDER